MSTATVVTPAVTRVLSRRPAVADELAGLVARRSGALFADSSKASGSRMWFALRAARARSKLVAGLVLQLAAVQGQQAPDPQQAEASAWATCFTLQYGQSTGGAFRELADLLERHLRERQVAGLASVEDWSTHVTCDDLAPDPRAPDATILEAFLGIGAARVADLADVERRLAVLASVGQELAESRAAATGAAVAAAGGPKALAIAIIEAIGTTTPTDHEAKRLKIELDQFDDQLSNSLEGGRLHQSLSEVRELAARRLRDYRVSQNASRQAAADGVVTAFAAGDGVAIGYVADLHHRQTAAFPADMPKHLAAADAVTPDQAIRIITASFEPI